MHYILISMVWASGYVHTYSVAHIEFNSLTACDYALKKLDDGLKDGNTHKLMCVPKGKENE